MFVQLYSVQAALANGGVTQVRSFAKEAAPVSGDGMCFNLLLHLCEINILVLYE